MGPGCKTVTRAAPDKRRRRLGRRPRRTPYQGKKTYGADVEGTQGKGTVGKFDGYKPLVVEICKFFKTEKAARRPRGNNRDLRLHGGGRREQAPGGAPVTIESVLAKARQAAAARQ